jgi:hypothetical protein
LASVPVRYFPHGLESIALPSDASDEDEGIPDEAISLRREHVSVCYEQDSHATGFEPPVMRHVGAAHVSRAGTVRPRSADPLATNVVLIGGSGGGDNGARRGKREGERASGNDDDDDFKPSRIVRTYTRVSTPAQAPERRELRQAKRRRVSTTSSADVGAASTPRPELATATAQELRKVTRKLRADVRNGEKKLSEPVIEYDHDRARDLKQLMLEGVQLGFPLEPLRPQLQLMRTALKALNRGISAALESPTGTGKTLALLAAVLGWQRMAAARTPPLRVRVVWVARTHNQLNHAVHEFKRLAERPMMALRLSRERYCLHPLVSTAPNKSEACEEATTHVGGKLARQSGCTFLDNAEAIGYPQADAQLRHFRLHGRAALLDIEEAVAEGHATHTCPFHAAQDLVSAGAALVFITYQQMLDPLVRCCRCVEDRRTREWCARHVCCAYTRSVCAFVGAADMPEGSTNCSTARSWWLTRPTTLRPRLAHAHRTR